MQVARTERTVRALARRFLSGGERRPFGVWGENHGHFNYGTGQGCLPFSDSSWAMGFTALHGNEARLEVNVPYVCDVGGESGVDSISSTVATRCSSALLLVSKKQRETQKSTSEKPRLINRSLRVEGRVDPRTRHI